MGLGEVEDVQIRFLLLGRYELFVNFDKVTSCLMSITIIQGTAVILVMKEKAHIPATI